MYIYIYMCVCPINICIACIQNFAPQPLTNLRAQPLHRAPPEAGQELRQGDLSAAAATMKVPRSES